MKFEQVNLEEIAKQSKELKKKAEGNGVESIGARFDLREIEEKVQNGEIEQAAQAEFKTFLSKRQGLEEQIKQANDAGKDSVSLFSQLKNLNAEYGLEGNSKKEFLKKGYYYEFRPFFDALPEDLPVPGNYKEVKNDRVMTEAEMIKGHTPFEKKEDAFGLACKLKKEGKNEIIWFKDNGELCKVYVRRDGSDVKVNPFIASDGWSEGYVSYFSN